MRAALGASRWTRAATSVEARVDAPSLTARSRGRARLRESRRPRRRRRSRDGVAARHGARPRARLGAALEPVRPRGAPRAGGPVRALRERRRDRARRVRERRRLARLLLEDAPDLSPCARSWTRPWPNSATSSAPAASSPRRRSPRPRGRFAAAARPTPPLATTPAVTTPNPLPRVGVSTAAPGCTRAGGSCGHAWRSFRRRVRRDQARAELWETPPRAYGVLLASPGALAAPPSRRAGSSSCVAGRDAEELLAGMDRLRTRGTCSESFCTGFLVTR